MATTRRMVTVFGLAGLALAGLPATPAHALAARQLIPCAVPANGDITFANGTTSTIDTTTLTIAGGFGTGVVIDNVAVFSFNSITVQSLATVLVTGTRPLALLSRTSIIVNGDLTVLPGTTGGGGPGQGPGAGIGGSGFGGGGGGGYGGIGGNGAATNSGPGGPIYGDFLLNTFAGGSGGGGSANGAGGGGGGAIALVANSSVVVGAGATVSANGAEGSTPGSGAGAGGGSGGAIVLRAPTVTATGNLRAVGGPGGNGRPIGGSTIGGGGGGAGGRIFLSWNTGSASSSVNGGIGGTSVTAGPGGTGANGTIAVRTYKLKVPQALPAVVRGSTEWRLRNSLTSGDPTVPVFTYGTRPLVPILGDWDGDGVRTRGIFKGGAFDLSNDNNTDPPDLTFTFGDPRGFPVVGDWNGDGLDDVAVFRNGLWEARLTGCETMSSFTFGTGTWPATVPVAGDWDGDGLSGIGTYTPSTGAWALRQVPTSITTDLSFTFPGGTGYYPVTGDWDADGDDTVGVKATAGTAWYLRNTNTGGPIDAGDITFDFGLANDLPLAWSMLPT